MTERLEKIKKLEAIFKRMYMITYFFSIHKYSILTNYSANFTNFIIFNFSNFNTSCDAWLV